MMIVENRNKITAPAKYAKEKEEVMWKKIP